MSGLRRSEIIWGIIFLSPWIAGFTLFVGGPMVASLYLSLTKYNVSRPPVFVGLKNYVYALTEDPLFWGSLGRTFYYAVVSVPVGIAGSLLLAVLLNQKLFGTSGYRTFFFLPHLTPVVASAIIWVWIFQADYGVLNYLLSKAHLPGPKWLGSTEWAIPALIIMSLWRSVGGNRMMIFLAGLQGVPVELYEAASIDGAGLWRRFWHITLPMISPTLFFNLVLGIIGALKVFAPAFIATQGGPAYATWFYALHMYYNAFQYFKMGYGSALAWIFLVVVMGITAIQFRVASRWVYYAGEVK